MTHINKHIGQKIKDLRRGARISQTALAKQLDVTPNTVSRWESGIYEPKHEDLERIARLFKKPIWAFFPNEIEPPQEELQALLSKAGDLPSQDIEELIRYSDFIRTRNAHQGDKGKRGKGDRAGGKK